MRGEVPVVIACCAILIASAAGQASTFKGGGWTGVMEGDTLREDLYAAGQTVAVDGRLEGDLIAAGQRIVVRGSVSQDVNAAGETIEIEGLVGDDARVAARSVVVRGTIRGDLVAAGADVRIERGGVVEGEVRATGGQVTMEGEVRQGLWAGGGRVRIDGPVGGGVIVHADEELEIGPGARIGGDLSYRFPREVEVRGSVAGKVTRLRPRVEEEKFPTLRWLWRMWGILARIAVGIILLALLRRQTEGHLQVLFERPWRTLGVGALSLILVPAICIVLLLLLVTIPAGLILVAFLMTSLYLGKVLAGIALGVWLLERLGSQRAPRYGALLVGILALFLLRLIPYLGWLVGIAAIVLGFGAIVLHAWRGLREARAAAAA